MKIKLLLLILLNCTMFFLLTAQQVKQGKKSNSTFLNSTIRFDNSSLKKIVLRPESILDAPEAFWENDAAYKLYKLWHQLIAYPVDLNRWKTYLQPFINTPAKDRLNNDQLILSQKALVPDKIQDFNTRAIPFLYSFLPANCPPIETTIYFTTAIQPNGFQMGNDVVIYGENADKENLLIHELFHRCQRACESISYKHESKDNDLDQIYLLLWIEGTATYVGYKALNEFPAVDPLSQKDYQLLEDTSNLVNHRRRLNELFKNVAKNVINGDELQQHIIQTGVIERTFYTVGFDMASTIDEKLGRDALKETLLHGPGYFIKKYNSIVNDDLKIVDLYSMRK